MVNSSRTSLIFLQVIAYLFGAGSIYLVYANVLTSPNFLFVSNLTLWFGVCLIIETMIQSLALIFERINIKKKTIVTHARVWFASFLILEIILRGTGLFLTHPEKNDGRYISSARIHNNPSWYWLHPPNDTLRNQNHEFKFYRTTNSLGLSEQAIPQKSNNTRLIALGDSFTEGVGVEQHEGWVKLIEKDFNAQGLRLETINAGIGGSDPVFEYKLFKDKLLKYQPDILILTINSTDVLDMIARGGVERLIQMVLQEPQHHGGIGFIHAAI